MARKKKNLGLLVIQIGWPLCAIALIIQSVAVSYNSSAAAAWAGMLPTLVNVVVVMGSFAGGGPLIADEIKRRAGILGREHEEG